MDAINKNTQVSDFEKQLFSGIAAGNEADFTTLFNLFLPKLHPFILRFTKSELATEEIIQETFIRVWLNRDKLEEIENPGGWLYKVASNECYSYVRKGVLNNKFSNVIAGDVEGVNPTHDKLDARDINHLVTKAVYKMPAQRRKIYLMSRDEGKTISQIAAALQISPNTVKNSLVTSLRFIREHLARHGVVFYLFILLFGKK